jgi:hypothetical protein
MPFRPIMSYLFANSSFGRLSRRFAIRMIGARRERGVARIWFLKLLCERLNLLGRQLNLFLEFLDLRLVTGDEGLDKVRRWLDFSREFEAQPSVVIKEF